MFVSVGVLNNNDLLSLRRNNAEQVAKKILKMAPTGIELFSGKPAVRVDFRNARAIARGLSAAAIEVVAYDRVQKDIGTRIGRIAFRNAMRANLGFSAASADHFSQTLLGCSRRRPPTSCANLQVLNNASH